MWILVLADPLQPRDLKQQFDILVRSTRLSKYGQKLGTKVFPNELLAVTYPLLVANIIPGLDARTALIVDRM